MAENELLFSESAGENQPTEDQKAKFRAAEFLIRAEHQNRKEINLSASLSAYFTFLWALIMLVTVLAGIFYTEPEIGKGTPAFLAFFIPLAKVFYVPVFDLSDKLYVLIPYIVVLIYFVPILFSVLFRVIAGRIYKNKKYLPSAEADDMTIIKELKSLVPFRKTYYDGFMPFIFALAAVAVSVFALYSGGVIEFKDFTVSMWVITALVCIAAAAVFYFTIKLSLFITDKILKDESSVTACLDVVDAYWLVIDPQERERRQKELEEWIKKKEEEEEARRLAGYYSGGSDTSGTVTDDMVAMFHMQKTGQIHTDTYTGYDLNHIE